jgi:tripartite-type tricarboxylate transporter receptor subunit TctC
MNARWVVHTLLAAAAVSFSGPLRTQPFPAKVVRIINAQGPGVLDVVARGYAQELTRFWGQPVVVESRPGAGSILGADAVAKSPPDGHTLLVTSSAALTVNPFVTRNMPYDPDRDLAPVFGIGRTPSLISVASSLPVKSVQELVALARQKPGALAYGSAGIGSATQLQTELFLSEVGGAKMLHVPYKGINDIVRGMAAGEVQVGLSSTLLSVGAARAGQIRPLALIGERRDREFPDVPTLREAGFPNSTGSIIWFGFALPAKTPQPLIDRIAADLARASVEQSQKKVLEQTGWEPMLLGPEPFAELIRRERALIGKIVLEIGLKPE